MTKKIDYGRVTQQYCLYEYSENYHKQNICNQDCIPWNTQGLTDEEINYMDGEDLVKTGYSCTLPLTHENLTKWDNKAKEVVTEYLKENFS